MPASHAPGSGSDKYLFSSQPKDANEYCIIKVILLLIPVIFQPEFRAAILAYFSPFGACQRL
jgi:hypothetical protein